MEKDKDRFLVFANKNLQIFEILIWYSCNANCFFCSNDPVWRNVDPRSVRARTDQVLKQIQDAKKSGFQILGLTGGEPTIYPDILKVVAYAKNLGFQTIRTQSNGIRLSDFDFCKKIIEAGVNFVKFSISSHKAAIHDYQSQVPGNFEMNMRAMDNLEKLEVSFEVNTVVTKLNYKFLPQFIAKMGEKKVSRIVIISPRYTGRMATQPDMHVTLTESYPYMQEAIDLAKDLGMANIILLNVPLCFMVGYENHVSERSPFNVEVSTPTSGKTQKLQENMVGGKVKSAVCRQCRYDGECNGVWSEYVDFFGLSEIKPVK
jgi:cyclic pyranopterin phosphate synthase